MSEGVCHAQGQVVTHVHNANLQITLALVWIASLPKRQQARTLNAYNNLMKL